MGKSDDDKPRFSFAKLADTYNYKKWPWEIQYSLESVGLWNHIFLEKNNFKPVAIVFKGKDLKDDTKFEHQEKCMDKIIA